MCDLCDSNKMIVERERRKLHNSAQNLRKLADRYIGLASGRIDPHGKEAADISLLAQSVSREILEEW